jgi:hypothetical protein
MPRTESVDPNAMNSIKDIADPNRTKLRMEHDEPTTK